MNKQAKKEHNKKFLQRVFFLLGGNFLLIVGMSTIYWSGYLGFAFNKVGGSEWLIMTYVTSMAGFACIGLYFQSYEEIKKIK